MENLRRRLDDLAEAHDLAALGIADAAPFDDARAALEHRVANGLNGGLRFTFAEPETATDIRQTFAWAQRLVVASRAYVPHAGSPERTVDGAVVARFAVDDPYAPLRRALAAIVEELRTDGFRAEVLVDDNRLVDRAAARRAGIAWQGKSTMMLDPRNGPWVVLGTVVTDAELTPDEPMSRSCGTCDACIPACPTGAIVDPGVLDARLCLAAQAQLSGTFPIELRPALADRLYGCDDCLDACPPGRQLLDTSTSRRGVIETLEVLELADDELLDRFGHFYLPNRSPAVLRRNALIVLGNAADETTVGVLAGYLGHADPMLRAHAAWALGRIGSGHAIAALHVASADETDHEVAAELALAVG